MRSLRRLTGRLAWERYIAGNRARWLIWDAVLAYTPRRGTIARLYDQKQTIPPPAEPCGFRPVLEQRRVTLTRLTGSALIEPKFGYIIAKPARLLPHLLLRGEYARRRSHMQFFSGTPSILDYIAATRGHRPVQRFPRVASLRQPFDGNYYHDLVEVLPGLALLAEHGVCADTPIVISEKLFNAPYFQWMLRCTPLRNWQWIVQGATYVEADTIYVPHLMRDARPYLDQFLDLIGAPLPDPHTNRRVFLTRDVSVGRAITNMDAIRPVLERYGFEEIDSGRLPLGRQMQLFSQTRFLVGLHGAGMANIIFRRGHPLSVLEIVSPYHSDAGFYHLSHSYGYDYEFITGEGVPAAPRHANFQLDPNRFEVKLRSLLATERC